MVDGIERRFLIVVRLSDDAAFGTAPVRTQAILDSIQPLARGTKVGLAFSSARGETFGIFLKTDRVAGQIRGAVETSKVIGQSSIMVLELGDTFDAVGNSSGWRWLQH